MACIVKLCRRNGLIHSCTNIEAINMSPPAIITRKYEDQCGCRTCCSYPNNFWIILSAQIITTTAFGLSVASIADCRLVKVPNTPENGIDKFTIRVLYNGTIPADVVNNEAPYRSIGLFGWEDIQSTCSYENYDNASSNSDEKDEKIPVLKIYLDFVGRDEFIPLIRMGAVVTVIGLLVWCWMVCILSCVAHTRRYRCILVAILTFILPLLQSLTFRILATEFCQGKDCELDEDGFMAISAIILYFTAGILICIGAQDFPGNPYKERKHGAILTFLRSCFSKRQEVESNDSNINNQPYNGRPTTEAEMVHYNNGFADAVEIPVESEFIDRTLIEEEEFPPTNTHVTINLTDLVNSRNVHAATTAATMNDIKCVDS